MRIKLFDTVRLKDGREGDVMEVFGDQKAFLLTLGDDPHWYNETVQYEDIERVIHESEED